jgi:DNA-directed RNA polymerase subunit RPC12/RpoP
MARHQENTGFICLNCNKQIEKLTNGSYRNHCPFCLYSLHVDIIPGDRANPCHGLMKPIGLTYKAKKGWQIIHRCLKCKAQGVIKVAVDTVQSDDYQQFAGWKG